MNTQKFDIVEDGDDLINFLHNKEVDKVIDYQTLQKETTEFNQHYKDIKERLNDIRLKSTLVHISHDDYDCLNQLCLCLSDINNRLKDMKDKQDLLLNTIIK